MVNSLTLFAGPICLNPHTERESFVLGLIIGGLLLGLFSTFFGIASLVVKIRHTFNPNRKLWAKRYGLSNLAFLLFMGLGWLIGTGGSANDYCRTAESSPQGVLLSGLAIIAILATLVSLFGFIFSFTPKQIKA